MGALNVCSENPEILVRISFSWTFSTKKLIPVPSKIPIKFEIKCYKTFLASLFACFAPSKHILNVSPLAVALHFMNDITKQPCNV